MDDLLPKENWKETVSGFVSNHTRSILEKALAREEVTLTEGEHLFQAKGKEIEAISHVANELRKRACGDAVSFVVNRNINFTNICYMGCSFCGFARRKEDADAQWLDPHQVVERALEAKSRGASEVCIQGGLHPDMPGDYYRKLLLAIKAEIPDIHIHAFSPFEIWYGAAKTRMPYREFLQDLKECGLGSMPGTAAEILDTHIRQQLTKNKLSSEQWVEIIRTAHQVGLRTTSTIMYGHIDGPSDWAKHICLLRDIQKETGGFTELVPLSFVHSDSPLYLQRPDQVRPGPTIDEVVKMHAVSRILLAGWIDNIQVSWTKLGPERARQMLECGVNDLGGTLMNESISRAAGARHGQEITAAEMVKLIKSTGRVPVRRNTLYQVQEDYDGHEPKELLPLVDRNTSEPLAFLQTKAPIS